MAKAKSRLKAAAASYTPQSREQVSVDIKKIGDIQRELTRIEANANDQIAVIMNQNTPRIEALRAELDVLKKAFRHGAKPIAQILRVTVKPKPPTSLLARCRGALNLTQFPLKAWI